MRIQRLLTLTLCAAATTGLLGVSSSPPDAHASCVGPSLTVGTSAAPGAPPSPSVTLLRGETTTVAGIFFHAGCEDTFESPGPGCQPVRPADPQSPLTDVHLTLIQGDRRWDLGSADAADRDQQYAISWSVSIPTDAVAGAATLSAESATLPAQIR